MFSHLNRSMHPLFFGDFCRRQVPVVLLSDRGRAQVGQVDGVVGASRDDNNLVKPVGQQVAVVAHSQLVVEGQPADPFHQLDHDGITDLPELVFQSSVTLQHWPQVDVLFQKGTTPFV